MALIRLFTYKIYTWASATWTGSLYWLPKYLLRHITLGIFLFSLFLALILYCPPIIRIATIEEGGAGETWRCLEKGFENDKKEAPQDPHHPIPQINWSLHIGRGERSRLNSPMCTSSPLQRGTTLPKWGCCKDLKPTLKHHVWFIHLWKYLLW